MLDKSAETTFDIHNVRREFPALAKMIYGHQLVYLDNAASAQKPMCVINAMSHAYLESYANVHRGLHYLANAATDAYENAREKVRLFLNAPSLDTIVFTKNATEAINIVAYGWGMPNLAKDDEIILTVLEHHSNLVPWHFIRERQQAKLVFLPVDSDGVLHIKDFENALTKKTRLVAVTHMSNVLGTILPIKEIVKIAHALNIPVLIDGAQGAVHLPIDVTDIDCDWYTMTGHKLYGPTGIGVLYGKKERLEAMRPFQGGGEMIENVTKRKISYTYPPHRFEAGTPPIVEAIGLGVALDYMNRLGRESLFRYEQEVTAYAYERLRCVQGVHLLGNPQKRGGIISFNLDGIHAHDLSVYVDREGIAIRAGTHCAQPLLQSFDTTSACRISLAFYNTYAEIDRLVEVLVKARSFFLNE
ncbi:MAG: cysteine desulfurase / selenocysteine lyase [Candidatus Tokpelaia sp. JSC161]|nr:MAG: cysteine desulfurase / selenocysteine lyase [Candidatus Tokpelaia sp. JSC161]